MGDVTGNERGRAWRREKKIKVRRKTPKHGASKEHTPKVTYNRREKYDAIREELNSSEY